MLMVDSHGSSVLLALLILGCLLLLSESLFPDPFDSDNFSSRICAIYEEMGVHDELPVNERESMLVGLVQERLPIFFTDNFKYFMDVDWDRKPETMERLLGMIENNDSYVLCDSIKDYYLEG